jgi:UDP-N-acetylglucosamine:LPS N-acetylglucosamine transferase
MTDIADLPPHFWIEPGPLSDQTPQQTQHLVCGSAHAVDQAVAAGHARDHITLTSGMILRPEFHQALTIDRHAERLALGLDPERPTGVLMFGGVGSAQMARISLALADVQLIVLCGRNDALADSIRAQTGVAPRAVLGFTSEVCRYLSLGDFFIGKPGPGSLSEAVQMGLPVITFDNAWTMPQERYNAQWIRGMGLGLVLKSQRRLPAAVAEMTARLPGFKARVEQVRNRAVFEVVEVFARLLSQSNLLDEGATAGHIGRAGIEQDGATNAA